MRKGTISEEGGVKSIKMGPRYAVFLSVGVALVISSVLLGSVNSPTLQAITLNLGLVSIAIVLVDQLWRLSGGDNPIMQQIISLAKQIQRLAQTVDVIESSKNIGLHEVYDRQANFGGAEDWINLIKSAVNNVDLMGRTLFKWTSAKELTQVILRKIEQDNVTFRWLIMSRKNRFLPIIEEVDPSSILDRKLEIVTDLLISIHGKLSEGKKEKFQVRTFSNVPLNCSILRIDDRVYIVQYLHSTSSDNCPLYCVRGDNSAWPETYMQEFKNIWDHSESLIMNQSEVRN